ncbi:energy transducer TonB [Pseudomonas sp. D2-5]
MVAPNRSSARLGRAQLAALIGTSVLLHAGLGWYLASTPPVPVDTQPTVPEMTVDLTSPTPPAPAPPHPPPPPEPEPEPEPPSVPEPPPVDENAVKPLPKPEPPKPQPKPAPKPVRKPKPMPAPPPPARAAPVTTSAAPPAPAAPTPPSAPAKETPAVSGLASLGNPPPEYPSLALRRRWEGSVTLSIRVLPNGRAGSVEVTRSSGREQLDEAAIAAVKGWKFIPAKRGGTPVEGFAVQTIDFKLPAD